MSNSLIAFDSSQIRVIKGDVTFDGYEELKEQAQKLSNEIKNIEVNDENIKVSKKMLAAVNKRLREIEDKRISIKKELLEPYNLFESQVKEIVTIVKDADGFVRNQVKELEEIEREEKKKELELIFYKRIKHYCFTNMFTFDDFLQAKHLNKSTSINSVEKEMVEWLEKVKADIDVIKSMPNTEEILTEYENTKDLAVSINIVNQRQERKRQLKEITESNKRVFKENQFIITIDDIKDFKLVELFMQQNNIKYKFEKVAK